MILSITSSEWKRIINIKVTIKTSIIPYRIMNPIIVGTKEITPTYKIAYIISNNFLLSNLEWLYQNIFDTY